jgi:hypothetical protein
MKFVCPPEVARVLKEIPIWTNFIYLLGAMYSYVHDMKIYALMFLVISIVSTIHHVYSERYLKNKTMRRIFYYTDVVICISLFVFFIALITFRRPPKQVKSIFTGKFGKMIKRFLNYKHLIPEYIVKNITTPEVFMILVLSGVGFYLFYKDLQYEKDEHGLYDIYHGFWHILTGFTMLLCVVILTEKEIV